MKYWIMWISQLRKQPRAGLFNASIITIFFVRLPYKNHRHVHIPELIHGGRDWSQCKNAEVTILSKAVE